MIKALFLNSKISFLLITITSFIALAAAFIAEGFLELEPCILCIYQRYPFALGLFLGLVGLALRKRICAVRAILAVTSINFFLNSALAFYHTGVEQHWWKSAVEGCAVPLFEDNSNKSILENIMSAPLGNCSEIPWQDPILGLSMANYNIALCLFLAVFCGLSAILTKKCQAPL